MEQALTITRQLLPLGGFSINMKLHKESIAILCIGLLDLISTLVWVDTHGAQEANPLFQYYLALGPVYFIFMKFIMLMAPIFLLEWAARKRPNFTRSASRFAVCAYLAMYVVGVAKLNPDLLHHQRQHTEIAAIEARAAESFSLPADDPMRGFSSGFAVSGPNAPSEGIN